MKMAVERGLVVLIGLILQLTVSLFFYLFFIENIVAINILFGVISILLTLALIKNSKKGIDR